MTARQLLGGLALAAVVLGAGWWTFVRDDTTWLVKADVRSYEQADADCGDLPGISGDRSFSVTADSRDEFAQGVEWRVERRDRADAVADCLIDHGGINVEVKKPGELTSFERTGP